MAGIVKSSLPNGRNLSAVAALHVAADLGVEALLFNSLFDCSPTLDPAGLAEVRDEADKLGLRISSILGVVNPMLPARSKSIIEAGEGDIQAGVERLTILAADIGVHSMVFTIGTIEDRFEAEVCWTAQLEAVGDLLERCAPTLRKCCSKLLLKTHEEITTFEILDLIERVGSDVLGVAFDPVNVLCRLEDPVAAAERVAHHVVEVFVDDAVVRFQEKGIRRFLAPLGDGFIDWRKIASILPGRPMWIEMHAGQFAMPVFDSEWLRQQPPIVIEEFTSVLAMAVEFGTRGVPCDQKAPVSRLERALERIDPTIPG